MNAASALVNPVISGKLEGGVSQGSSVTIPDFSMTGRNGNKYCSISCKQLI